MSRPAAPEFELDDVDWTLLRGINHDARISMTALAELVGISRASAYTRVNKLISHGVIRGFSTRIDPISIGRHASAYVSLAIDQRKWHDIRVQLNEIEEVDHVALVGGNFDVMLLVRGFDTSHLREIVLNKIQSIPGVKKSRTLIIFEDFDRGFMPSLAHDD